jgi:hypothetical protein
MNQGPRYVRLMEKSRGQKSCATVPLSKFFCYFYFADARATNPLKVLTLQQLNSKNIRKIMVLSLHRAINGTNLA